MKNRQNEIKNLKQGYLILNENQFGRYKLYCTEYMRKDTYLVRSFFILKYYF
jgi:hypothetical protein